MVGPPGISGWLTEAMEVMFPGSSTVRRRFAVEVVELESGGKAVGYTGDTAWTDTLVDIASGADLFIAESYFWDKAVPYHLRHAFPVARDGLVIEL